MDRIIEQGESSEHTTALVLGIMDRLQKAHEDEMDRGLPAPRNPMARAFGG